MMIEIAPAMSAWSWSLLSSTPSEGWPRMMTTISAAIRPCQPKAQPCLSPLTKAGRVAGMITCR